MSLSAPVLHNDWSGLEAGAAKGLDWGADYHIIKNSLKAAAARSGEPGGLRGEYFRKNIDNLCAGSYTYKVKIWAVLA
jgi:hypothetical protein